MIKRGHISRFCSEKDQSRDAEIELKGSVAAIQPKSDTTSKFVRQCYQVSPSITPATSTWLTPIVLL